MAPDLGIGLHRGGVAYYTLKDYRTSDPTVQLLVAPFCSMIIYKYTR